MNFKATLEIIDINPYVQVPDAILAKLLKQADKELGPIPVCGTINDLEYKQTLVKFRGMYRLYINTKMLKNSPSRIGEEIRITIAYDPVARTINPHPDFLKQLRKNATAKKVFDALSPSRRNEIVRYIANLKTEESIQHNISKAINFLLGKESFAGREKP